MNVVVALLQFDDQKIRDGMQVNYNSCKDYQPNQTPRDQEVRYRYRSTSVKGALGRYRQRFDKLKNKCRNECGYHRR